MTHALLKNQPPSFRTILFNGLSYISVHARGIPYVYEYWSNVVDKYGNYLSSKKVEVEVIQLPTLEGNMEEVLDKALREIKEKGVLK